MHGGGLPRFRGMVGCRQGTSDRFPKVRYRGSLLLGYGGSKIPLFFILTNALSEVLSEVLSGSVARLCGQCELAVLDSVDVEEIRKLFNKFHKPDLAKCFFGPWVLFVECFSGLV